MTRNSVSFRGRRLLPLLFLVLMGARCCSVIPSAFVFDPPDFKWVARIEGAVFDVPPNLKDSATVIDLAISSFGQMTDYRYKIGQSDLTNCAEDVGYTDWIPAASRLQEDIAALPDGWVRLCLLGKGLDTCANQVVYQPVSTPTVLRWQKDTTPPGDFSIQSPVGSSISSLDTTVVLTASIDAVAYDVTVSTTNTCSTGIIAQQHLTGGALSFPLTLPAFGTYYVCAKAVDDAALEKTATNSGASFVAAQFQEVIAKDHVTDASCWNSTNAALTNFNGPGAIDAIAAAAFTAGGGIVKRVGGIFATSNCSVFNAGNLGNMTASVAFYENKDVFLADPYLTNQPVGSRSKRVAAQILHTESGDPKYYLNPVNTTSQGTNQFYVEVDASAANLQTTQGQEHLVALWLSSDSNDDGIAWSVFSQGCPNQVGNNVDYYKSDNDHNPKPAAKLSEVSGAAHSFGAFFVSELR